MYEHFSDRARKVLQLANQEAQRFNHEYIGTEHVLLGLIKEDSGVAANVFKQRDIDLYEVRLEVEKIIQPGPNMVTIGKLPQTPRVKKAIEYAIEEARDLEHKYIGTEHLLLGLLREGENVAAQILMNLGLNLQDVREEILVMLGYTPFLVSGYTPTKESLARREQRQATNSMSQNVAKEQTSSNAKENMDSTVNQERIHSLEQQVWNMRVVLGALVGALVGALLFASMGTVIGLLVGGVVAALGWRSFGILSGGGAGALLGCVHLLNEWGGLAGALLGGLLGFLIAEIGGSSDRQGFLGCWRKR